MHGRDLIIDFRSGLDVTCSMCPVIAGNSDAGHTSKQATTVDRASKRCAVRAAKRDPLFAMRLYASAASRAASALSVPVSDLRQQAHYQVFGLARVAAAEQVVVVEHMIEIVEVLARAIPVSSGNASL
jgi:hypothetical protein